MYEFQTADPPAQPVAAPVVNVVPVPQATILRHCRCRDCIGLSGKAGQYVCIHDIGGTKVVWATGQHICDPPPDAWHYCSCYEGPQISNDVWVWPKEPPRTPPVGPRSNIAAESANGSALPPSRPTTVAIGTPDASVAADGGGNGRRRPFSFRR